ncbi:hypothetical protein QO005_000889 [Rhizobium paknamense]|uniref:Uncharacterized protein n=1 Tax=Rhizobium paknamense TaxID=1206817 RepID=A0ABU0I8J6_9HYPH|nr:hypothetical protein [Rhizobium paknamense]
MSLIAFTRLGGKKRKIDAALTIRWENRGAPHLELL